MKQDAAGVASNTFIQAPQYSPEMIKVMGVGGMVQTYYGDHWPYPPPHYGNPPRQTFEGFLNEYVRNHCERVDVMANALLAIMSQYTRQKHVRILTFSVTKDGGLLPG